MSDLAAIADPPALAFALRYALAGLPVLACAPRGKIPLFSGGRGVLDATTNPDQIRKWWRGAPMANVGIAAPLGYAALDIDAAHGGLKTLAELEGEHGALPETWQARTGGGGMHIWFSVPADVQIKNTVAFRPGLDWRGHGTYVVAPPSLHPNGHQYAWERGAADCPIAAAPAWLLDLVRAGKPKTKKQAERAALAARAAAEYASNFAANTVADAARTAAEAGVRARVTDGTATPEEAADLAEKDCARAAEESRERTRQARQSARLARIETGERNDTLFKTACALRGQGLSGEALAAALDAENQAKCMPPLDAAEVQRIAASAAGYAPNETAETFVARVMVGLGDSPGADGIEASLRLVAEAGRTGDTIRRAALRAAVVAALKERGVAGPAALADAALGGSAAATDDARQGNALTFDAPEPWPDPVDGAALLDEIEAALRKYVVMPGWAFRLSALWIVHTWAFDAADFTARLFFTSAEKGSGKSRALAVVAAMSARVLSTSGITAAALFRTISAHHPSLTVDECDTFLRDSEEIRGVLNSGFERGGAVIRCVGDDAEPRRFDCFAPVALAGIGRLPGTIEDRAIIIPMQRRLPSEKVEPFRKQAKAALADVRRRCARWAADHVDALKGADPSVPAALDDRAADILGPLLAVADSSGGKWPAFAREAALEGLCGRRDDDQSSGTRLLADVRAIFADLGTDRISTVDLLTTLVSMDERPWSDYRRGKAINARQIAGLLKAYDVRSKTLGSRSESIKGYALSDFADAFQRYLPAPGGNTVSNTSPRRQGLQPNENVACVGDGKKNEKALATDTLFAPAAASTVMTATCENGDVATDRKPKSPTAGETEDVDARYEREERLGIQTEDWEG